MEYEFIEHQSGMDVKLFAAAASKPGRHYHGELELLLPLRGSVSVELEEDRFVLEEGELFVINRNEVHSILGQTPDHVLLVMEMSTGFCETYYPRLERVRFLQRRITKEEQSVLHGLLMDQLACAVACFRDRKEGYQLALTGSLHYILYHLLDWCAHVEQTKEELVSRERNRARLSAIVEFIQHNFMHKLTLFELAQREGLDMTYLSHFIKNNLGVTFRDYVNKLRLARAIELICTTDMRKTDICKACGYSDYRYLNKAILEKYGCSPGQLRKEKAGSGQLFWEEDGAAHPWPAVDQDEAFHLFFRLKDRLGE